MPRASAQRACARYALPDGMFSAERLSAIEMICIQSHVTAGMTTDEVASEMAKQVGKVASNDLIVDTDESFCDVMSGRYRGWAYPSTLNELDCPSDAAGADSAPRKCKGWLDQALEASGTGQRTSLRRGREHASDRAHAPARRWRMCASRRPAGDAGEDAGHHQTAYLEGLLPRAG